MLLAASETKPDGKDVVDISSMSQSGLTLTTENRPVVSVCIPTYNGREHLAECISSIRAQSFTDFEVVICDDHSSDGTLDFARLLAQGDARFRFISNPRRLGLVGNWNNCVDEARGEWIKFVFQDDTIAPTCIETLLDACKGTGKVFSFCQRDFIFENETPDTLREFFLAHRRRLCSDYSAGPVIGPDHFIRIAAHEPRHNFVGEPTVTLINRSVFREIGRFDDALIQLCDAEFWCRVGINYGAVFVPESLAAFRIHAMAATSLNHQDRAFRGQVVDPLVIRHHVAFGPHFKAMRNRKVSGVSTLWLWMKCADYATEVWNVARRNPNHKSGDASCGMLAEWNAVKRHCSGLQFLAWLGMAVNFGRRVKARIAPKAT
jgi:glycosyltransferase involved in cell wall biosynthesis